MGRGILLWRLGLAMPIPIIVLLALLLHGGRSMALADSVAVVVEEKTPRSPSAVSWAAIIGGALTAVAVTLLLVARHCPFVSPAGRSG